MNGLSRLRQASETPTANLKIGTHLIDFFLHTAGKSLVCRKIDGVELCTTLLRSIVRIFLVVVRLGLGSTLVFT